MEIYIRDFKEEKQEEILKELSLNCLEDGNLDEIPLFVLEK